MREFKINANDAGQRLDKFIQKTVKGMPVSLMYKAIRLKKIKVNRKRAEQKQILAVGDVVQMFLNEDLFAEKIADRELLSMTPNINVLYEDENIILCNKPAGILVHSGDGDGKTSGDGSVNDRNTLVYHMQAYLAQNGEYDPADENSFAPALCNRIDRNTGGIVIGAKNAQTLRDINARIRDNYISKYYLCAVHGKLPEKSNVLKDFLVKNSNTNTVKVLKTYKPGAKEIITKYSVVDYNKSKDLSLLEIELITGRTHQIRAHMASIGHPLAGDGKYGTNEFNKKTGRKTQALYSYKLRFNFKDENELSYLNGKTFEVSDVPFAKEIL